MTRPNIEAIRERQVSEESRRLVSDAIGSAFGNGIVSSNVTRATLLAHIATLEADKERLDWLESERAQIFTDNNRVNIFFGKQANRWLISADDLTDARPDSLREAIDAASPSLVDTETKEIL